MGLKDLLWKQSMRSSQGKGSQRIVVTSSSQCIPREKMTWLNGLFCELHGCWAWRRQCCSNKCINPLTQCFWNYRHINSEELNEFKKGILKILTRYLSHKIYSWISTFCIKISLSFYIIFCEHFEYPVCFK